MVTDTITIPWTSAATAETYTYTALASGGNRESTVANTHDSYGRVTQVSSVPDTADAAEDTCTTTTYASNTSKWIMDLPSEVSVVSVSCGTTASLPADAVSDELTFYDGSTSLASTTYDPLRELPLTVTSPAGWTSTEEYDSLGQVVETQAENADGDTVVTDTYYNSDGWTVKTSGPYYVTGAPTGKLEQAADDEVPTQTADVYDGAGRVTRAESYSLAKETWETDTAYGGDYTTTTYQNLKSGEPDGGTPETVFTNGEGQTSAVYQYHSEADAALGPSAPAADWLETRPPRRIRTPALPPVLTTQPGCLPRQPRRLPRKTSLETRSRTFTTPTAEKPPSTTRRTGHPSPRPPNWRRGCTTPWPRGS